MNAPAIKGAFADRLPATPATAKEAGKQALRAKLICRELETAEPAITDSQWKRLDNQQIDAAEAFFTALERETGIDRSLFRELSELI